MAFTTEGFFEVARESWSEWDLNPWPLPILFRHSDRLSYQAMSWTCSQSQLCTATSISSLCSTLKFHFGLNTCIYVYIYIYIYVYIYILHIYILYVYYIYIYYIYIYILYIYLICVYIYLKTIQKSQKGRA